ATPRPDRPTTERTARPAPASFVPLSARTFVCALRARALVASSTPSGYPPPGDAHCSPLMSASPTGRSGHGLACRLDLSSRRKSVTEDFGGGPVGAVVGRGRSDVHDLELEVGATRDADR